MFGAGFYFVSARILWCRQMVKEREKERERERGRERRKRAQIRRRVSSFPYRAVDSFAADSSALQTQATACSRRGFEIAGSKPIRCQTWRSNATQSGAQGRLLLGVAVPCSGKTMGFRLSSIPNVPLPPLTGGVNKINVFVYGWKVVVTWEFAW